MKPIVYVIDDDQSIREWIAEIVASVNLELEVFADARTFLSSVDTERYGCAIVDLRLPLTSGVELLRQLNELGVPLSVIMMSAYCEVPSVVEAMRQGAVQFLEKPFSAQYLIDEVHRAIESARLRGVSLEDARETRSRLDGLTSKEREVLYCVVQGQANKVIAHELGITEKAVEDRRARMMQKMKAGSIAELVRRITQLGDQQ